MTKETLDFLRWMLSRQTIEVGAPDAAEISRLSFAALAELDAAIAALETEGA